eukprot:3833829-Prymnesium_polylepis.1
MQLRAQSASAKRMETTRLPCASPIAARLGSSGTSSPIVSIDHRRRCAARWARSGHTAELRRAAGSTRVAEQ